MSTNENDNTDYSICRNRRLQPTRPSRPFSSFYHAITVASLHCSRQTEVSTPWRDRYSSWTCYSCVVHDYAWYGSRGACTQSYLYIEVWYMVVCIEQITQRVQRGALLITLIVVPLLLDEPRRGRWKHTQYLVSITYLHFYSNSSIFCSIFRVVIDYRGIETGIETSFFHIQDNNNVDFYRTASKLSVRCSTPTTVLRTWAN